MSCTGRRDGASTPQRSSAAQQGRGAEIRSASQPAGGKMPGDN